MTYDNGLSEEQQKIVDARYEELMAQLKEVNPHYHKQLMKELEQINSDRPHRHYQGVSESYNKLNYKQLELSL